MAVMWLSSLVRSLSGSGTRCDHGLRKVNAKPGVESSRSKQLYKMSRGQRGVPENGNATTCGSSNSQALSASD
jgi:hypothetical protein